MEEITVPKEWFEHLARLLKQYNDPQRDEKSRENALNYLLGYVSSIKTILRIKT